MREHTLLALAVLLAVAGAVSAQVTTGILAPGIFRLGARFFF